MLSAVSPRVGIATLPPAPSRGAMNGWVWVSWCSSAHQVSWAPASGPSSASSAAPPKVIDWPARKVLPSAGVSMRASGASLLVLPPPQPASAIANAAARARARPPSASNPAVVIVRLPIVPIMPRHRRAGCDKALTPRPIQVHAPRRR